MASASDAELGRADPGRRTRVFLVEDNAMLREELIATLHDLTPVQVVGTAASGREACTWMDTRTQACDVAIVDMFLQAGNGLDVLRHMAGYERPPQRLVLTNYATDQMRKMCLELGADAVFDKSTQLDELVARLSL